MRKGNIIAGLICAAVAVYVIVTCLGYPRAEVYGTGVPGPGLWPGIIAALLLICSVGLIVVTLMMKKDQFPELPMWTPGTKRVYISMAILLVYMLVLSTLGFIIPSVIMLFGFIQWFHKGAIWKKCTDLRDRDPGNLLCFQELPECADRLRYVQHLKKGVAE